MDYLINLFDINSTIFTIFGYQMSYIEFFGTALNIWCVYLTTRAKILSWPIGLLGSALYLCLFYQIQLYSDLFEQVYFIITGFAGWYAWQYYKKDIIVAGSPEQRIVDSNKAIDQFLNQVL